MFTTSLPEMRVTTAPRTPRTADTILDTPSMLILVSTDTSLSATPSPLLNLKQSFFLHPKYLPHTPSTPSYEPANPYRDCYTDEKKPLPPCPPSPPSTSGFPFSKYAPPRFSNRLRALVSQRPQPLYVRVVPPPMSEKQRLVQQMQKHDVCTALTAGSAAWAESPRMWLEGAGARTWMVMLLLVCGGAVCVLGGWVVWMWMA